MRSGLRRIPITFRQAASICLSGSTAACGAVGLSPASAVGLSPAGAAGLSPAGSTVGRASVASNSSPGCISPPSSIGRLPLPPRSRSLACKLAPLLRAQLRRPGEPALARAFAAEGDGVRVLAPWHMDETCLPGQVCQGQKNAEQRQYLLTV